MRKREIIFAVIVSIMILCNIIGIVAVVAVNVTSGRDLVKECLMFFAPETSTNRQMIPVKEEWTTPTKTTEPIPTEEPRVEIDTVEVIETSPEEVPEETILEENTEETIEPTIESILETAPAEEIIDNEIDESTLAVG